MALIEINWRPPHKQLRQFAGILLGFAPLLAVLLHFRFEVSTTLAASIGGAGMLAAVIGLIYPPLIWPLFVVLMAITLPIGMVVSTVLMVAIYYLVMTPIGLLARLGGYDPLRRRSDPDAESYWIERTQPASVKRYFRQY